MKCRPIILNTDEVKSVLKHKKTQIRKVIKPQPDHIKYIPVVVNNYAGFVDEHGNSIKCPYGQIGDRLWVRETYTKTYDFEDHPELSHSCTEFWDTGIAYKADGKPYYFYDRWYSPVTMPRWASRITLEITNIRVERVQNISDNDIEKEGTPGKFNGEYQCPDCNGSGWMIGYPTCRHCNGTKLQPKYYYRELWNSLYPCYSENGWKKNPWVWVIEFKVVEK